MSPPTHNCGKDEPNIVGMGFDYLVLGKSGRDFPITLLYTSP
jgi:hypothetical protein